ncbi:hypothetical protein Tco_0058418 [Tanacetum coccineum]
MKILHVFGCKCYIVRDGKNLDKMKEKRDACIFVGYATQSKGFRVYNKRTVMIVETIHVNFDELQEMTSEDNTLGLAPQRQMMFEQDSSSLAPQRLTTASEHNGLGLAPQCQKILEQQCHEPSSSTHVQDNLSSSETTHAQSMSELVLLFSHMFDEYFKGENEVVFKPFAVFDKSNTTQSTTTVVAAEEPQLIVYNIPDPTTPTS